MPSATNILTQRILSFLLAQRCHAWRQNTTGLYDPVRRSYRLSAKKGVPDILACCKGQFLAVEIKTGSDRLSLEQEGFIRSTKITGGIALVVSSYNDFIQQISSVDNSPLTHHAEPTKMDTEKRD